MHDPAAPPAAAAPRSCPGAGRPPRAPTAARARVRVRRALDMSGSGRYVALPTRGGGGGPAGGERARAPTRKRADTPGWPPRPAARRRDDDAAGLVARLSLDMD